MDKKEVLNELRLKRNETERRLASYQKKHDVLEEELSINKALLDYSTKHVSPNSYLPHTSLRRLFERGEIQDFCLEALRESGRPLDTRELAVQVIKRKGLDADDRAVRKKVIGSVQQSLKSARNRRLVKSEPRRLGVRVWSLRDDEDS